MRRGFLASAAATLAAAGVTAAAAAAGTPVAPSPDAELIRVCTRFAEAEFTGWYRYITSPIDQADALADAGMWVMDWPALEWIAAAPATTPEGWRAKALAFVALDRDAFDDTEESDAFTPLLASLLRDMVRPARAAIIARLVEQHGLLPDGYAPDGTWVGRTAA